MDRPDYMIDHGNFLSVNFCLCKIRYQVKNLWDQSKGAKEDLSTLTFFELKSFFIHISS